MRRVDPKLYTTDYYLTDCTGFGQFKRSWGQELEPRFQAIVPKLPPVSGLKVLDIGCGRGELIFWSLDHGAHQALGIDYSPSAIKLANKALTHYPVSIRRRARFRVLDAKHLKFPPRSFDAVLLTEVLEHLYPEEQDRVLSQVTRILKPGGWLFVHTSPSRIFIDFTYPRYCYPVGQSLVWLWNFLFHRHYPGPARPGQLRTPSHLLMHVAEPDYFSLARLFSRHGLAGPIRSTNVTIKKPVLSWKDSLFNFLVYLTPVSNYFPFNIWFANDFHAVLRLS